MPEAKKPWMYNPQTEKFECIEPGCTYSNVDPSAVRLHTVRLHKAKTAVQKKPDVVPAKTKRKRGHECDYRLLRGTDPLEAKAISLGYTRVCKTCENLG